MDEPRTIRIEELLTHSDWLRRLARGLAGDPATADDVYQETMVGALRAPPSRDAGLRGWLATVARNAFRQLRRKEGARSARERATARAESGGEVARVAERLDLERRVARAVLELDEPARAVVLLRYYEGLTATEIGRRLGLPASTVRSRLSRALGRLRERLDGEVGRDRDRWIAILLTRAVRSRSVRMGAGVIMGTKGKLVLAVAVLSVVAAGGLVLRPGGHTWHDPAPEPARAGSVPDPTPVAEVARKAPTAAPVATSWRTPGPDDVSGTVRDETGAPLGGGMVRGFTVASGPDGERELGRAAVDAEGRWTLGPYRDRVVLEATAKGHAAERRMAGPGSHQDFVLGHGGRVSGTVCVAVTGAPVEGALVFLDVDPQFAPQMPEEVRRRTAASGADGSFAFDGVAPGLYDVIANPAGAPPARKEGLAITAGSDSRVLLEVPPGVRLSGRVHDADTGKGVAGVRVTVKGAPRLTAVSAADGSFAIAGFPRGSSVGVGPRRLIVELPVQTDYVSPTFLSSPQVELDPGGGDVTCDIPLERAGSISGTVVDPLGKPVAGARVTYHLFNVEGKYDQAIVTTESDGSFFLPGVPPANWPLYAMMPGYAVIETSRVEVRAGEVTKGVVVPLARGTPLEGVVVDGDGAPVAGAKVYFRQEQTVRYHDGPLNPGGETTDSEGRFRFPCVPAGRGSIDVSAADTLPATVPGLVIHDRGKNAKVRVVVSRGIEVRGRVLDPDGNPVSGIRVALMFRGTRPAVKAPHPFPRTNYFLRTGGDGRFSQPGCLDGPWRLTAAGATSVEWRPGDEEPLLVVPSRRGVIRGTIALPGGGTPGFAEVWAAGTFGPSCGVFAHWAGNPAEGFALTGLADGPYQVRAGGGPGLYTVPVEVEVKGGHPTSPVRLAFLQGGTLSGTVFGLSGRPASGARVRAMPEGKKQDRRSSGRTGEGGELRIGPTAPGRYRVEVEGSGGHAAIEVELKAGKEIRRNVQLDAGLAVRVEVVGPDGRPVPGAQVDLRDAGGELFTLDRTVLRGSFEAHRRVDPNLTWAHFEASRRQTDRGGILLLRSVPAGRYRVSVKAKGRAGGQGNVEVKKDTLARVRIELR